MVYGLLEFEREHDVELDLVEDQSGSKLMLRLCTYEGNMLQFNFKDKEEVTKLRDMLDWWVSR